MNNEWLIQIYHALESDEFNRVESITMTVSDGESQFNVARNPARASPNDKVRVLKNGEPFNGNWIVYADNIVVIDLPAPSTLVEYKAEVQDSICQDTVPANVVATWREEFEAKFYNVDHGKSTDAWERIQYENDPVQNLWAGFVAGKQTLADMVLAEKKIESEAQTLFVLWTESGVVHANEFANTPDARQAAKECLEFVDGRAGAELKDVIIGSKYDTSKL